MHEEIATREVSAGDIPSVTRRYLAVLIDGVLIFTVFMVIAYVFQGNEGAGSRIRGVGLYVASSIRTHQPCN
jgi:hypothetical protein